MNLEIPLKQKIKAGRFMSMGANVLRLIAFVLLSSLSIDFAMASSGPAAVERNYAVTPPAPKSQNQEAVNQKSDGCQSCHTKTDKKNMHVSDAVVLGCTDCHGGDASVFLKEVDGKKFAQGDHGYQKLQDLAHVLPLYPDSWNYLKDEEHKGEGTGSANPERTYALLNHESSEFIRFMNPSDFRVARDACGSCHMEYIEKSIRSLHATSAMLWGGASYNNGILPFKNYILGESYDDHGIGTVLKGPAVPAAQQAEAAAKGIIPVLYPLPAWETIKPGDIFRVFERGGRNITNLFPETGIPNSTGLIQRLEEPGRPDIKQSNRGEGTGGRISVPVINITKTRLNDPNLWFMGTNDQPGDYRNSGCSACHVVYANDREKKHSGGYAKFGHEGKTQTVDPTIDKEESGHPLTHSFTRAIPTSQCMICHMHQPNMFMNTYLGYTMWDYESDAPFMWPEEQKYPTHKERRETLDRNPEGASPRGKWADLDFLKQVSEMNPELKDTQFADYHGHGWNFRAIFKRDRKGNLLDAEGEKVSDDDPEKFKKAVHMSSIHLDKGMHCVDCHFSQDSHGSGHIYGEVALAVEVGCKDCHGTVKEYPSLRTSGPAALGEGTDLSSLYTPDGRRRFKWVGDDLYQRSSLDPDLEWKMSLVRDSVTSNHKDYNEKAARSKLMSKDTTTQKWSGKGWGPDIPEHDFAHSDDEMECYACHTSWTTACGGCHLPIQANEKTERHHYEGGESRNFATYNPQVARDQIFSLGRRGEAKSGKIAPVRSTSALVLSSTNSNREKIYVQQPPVSSAGYSSQAFNPHFPHTVRKTETRICSDCHLSEEGDNNAIMAQTLLLGTNFINFIGHYAWVGGEGEVTGVEVTEWQEPQAVLGSYLHKYAYPDFYKKHQENDKVLQKGFPHEAGDAGCIQMRGEYLYVAEGKKGFRVYDIASIGNKGVSQRIITAPFSPVGHDTAIASSNATCMALATTQPVNAAKNNTELNLVTNQEQPIHPIYNYAFITDAEEGLILTDINTLADGEPRNNFLERQLTWNENGVLNGAKHIVLGGYYAYIVTDAGLVTLNLNNPLKPVVTSILPLNGAKATAQQFRYLFVTDMDGLKVVDITKPEAPVIVPNNTIALANANRVYVARTYAYVAAGEDGLVIVDIEKPKAMKLLTKYTAEGQLKDSRDVVVASTNATLYAYVADGAGGLKVLHLTSPDSQPKFYGFSPEPKPELIAVYPTSKPAISLSKGLARDRGVDETGGQVAVFGRKGSRPLNQAEMEKMYLDKDGKPWFVKDKLK